MRLKVFDTINEALALPSENSEFYHKIEWETEQYLITIFKEFSEMIIDINSRVKSRESLHEKIIRNRFYVKNDSAQGILDNLSDLIGFIIECRFIEDEYNMLNETRETLSIHNEEDGFYYNEINPHFFLDCASRQSRIQRNGFAICRIDSYYLENEQKVNVELQVKTLVRSFWDEVEHKLVYKNTNYYVYDDFMKDLLASIKASLTITDQQLSIIYNRIQETPLSDASITETGFERQISKVINNLFTLKMSESIGFTVSLKGVSTILGHYIFIKNIHFDGGNNDHISSLFRTFKKLSSIQMDFKNEILIDAGFYSKDVFVHILGNYLILMLNRNYDWFTFFKMLFAIELGNNMKGFCLFLDVIRNYLVDNYWLDTSFVRLPMDQSDLLREGCTRVLASSLCEIGTTGIIRDGRMVVIDRAFVRFVEELESRVISYSGFMQYRSVYCEDWMQHMNNIFQK